MEKLKETNNNHFNVSTLFEKEEKRHNITKSRGSMEKLEKTNNNHFNVSTLFKKEEKDTTLEEPNNNHFNVSTLFKKENLQRYSRSRGSIVKIGRTE